MTEPANRIRLPGSKVYGVLWQLLHAIKRYVDDLILAVPQNEIDNTLRVFNSYDNDIQFAVEREQNNCIPFLDMLIHRDQHNKLATKWYGKSMSSGRYINIHSYRQNRMKLNLISALKARVRRQHQDRAIDFLVKELKVCTAKEAEERIFFISAKEVLQARLAEQCHTVLTPLTDGFQTRYFEFQDFERKFEECISKSAVKTKFEQHSQRGRYIASELRDILDGIYSDALKLKEEKLMQRKELTDKITYTEQQLIIITQEMKKKIHCMVEDVEQRVSKALNEEIRRLSSLVDEFNLPFHPEPLVLNVYKKELHLHVETGLGSNLRARLSTALALNMEASQREMTERMNTLIPENHKAASTVILPRRQPFEILYRLNCDNLCADFQEDLEFR
ncbi:transmembrane GTPase Marf-like [Anoplophora glabripennis]|uniref:transmembrane GTPase Marf-like n=1 Tax=Anoplophora glabripennis TaxID=217634 RepID=UPI000C787F30|nr:transmembrane GTPase Marf-like [Anoplophora glabripennis]